MLRSSLKSQKRQLFNQRLKISEILYERGVRLLQLGIGDIYSGNHLDACDSLEQAVSVFAEVKVSLKWEHTKIEDLACSKLSHLEEELLLSNILSSPELRIKIFELLSQCYFQMRNSPACVRICDYLLHYDPRSVRMLLRRAKARLMVDGVSEQDYRNAHNDLLQAMTLNGNDVEIKKEFISVQQILKEFKSSKQGQGEQKQFRKEMTLQQKQQQLIRQHKRKIQDESDSDLEDHDRRQLLSAFNFSADADSHDYELSYEQDPTKPIPIEVNELGKFIETRGMEILRIYEQSGRKKEAEELKDKLKKALAAKKQLEKISQLDFNRPKKKLQQIAQQFGIDLHDPQVQNEFKKIQQQNIEDIRLWLKQNQWNYEDVKKKEFQQISDKQSQRPKIINNTNHYTYNKTVNYENKEQQEEEINCGGIINNLIIVLTFLAFISTIYYSFIK